MPGFIINGLGVGPSSVRETSRKHRFLVRLLNPLSSDLLFFAKKFDPPQVEFDRIVMHHGQDEIYLPGKNRWLQCGLSFYRIHSTNGDRAAAELYDWWSKVVLRVNRSELNEDASSKSPLKRNGEVHILDGAGNSSYVYVLYGIWPQKISPDPFDFSDSAISEIKVILMVDKVKEVRGPSEESATAHCDGAGAGPIPVRNDVAIDNVQGQPLNPQAPPVELKAGGVGRPVRPAQV